MEPKSVGPRDGRGLFERNPIVPEGDGGMREERYYVEVFDERAPEIMTVPSGHRLVGWKWTNSLVVAMKLAEEASEMVHTTRVVVFDTYGPLGRRYTPIHVYERTGQRGGRKLRLVSNPEFKGVVFSIPNLRPDVKRTKSGIPVVRGRAWGHPRVPKRYRRMGATKSSDFAYPERFMYPLYFRDASGKLNIQKSRRHVANAKTRFSANKTRYPAAIRVIIAENINKAARRVGLAADVRP